MLADAFNFPELSGICIHDALQASETGHQFLGQRLDVFAVNSIAEKELQYFIVMKGLDTDIDIFFLQAPAMFLIMRWRFSHGEARIS
jgi:hypothetical protein